MRKKDWIGRLYRLCIACTALSLGACGGCSLYLRETYDFLGLNEIVSHTFGRNVMWTMLVSFCAAGIHVLAFIPMYDERRGRAYWSTMCVISTLTVVAGGICYGTDVSSRIDYEMFERAISVKYGYDIAVTDIVDEVQGKYECCGVTGNVTAGVHSWGLFKLQSSWYVRVARKLDPIQYVPASCCHEGATTDECQSTHERAIPSYGPPIYPGVNVNPVLYTEGCGDALSSDMSFVGRVIGYLTISVLISTVTGFLSNLVMLVRSLLRLRRRTVSSGGKNNERVVAMGNDRHDADVREA